VGRVVLARCRRRSGFRWRADGGQELDRTRRARVQYLPSQPERSRLFFPWMTADTATRANRVDGGIVVSLLATGVLLIGSGGAAARRQATAEFAPRRENLQR
jgi:hypothetical protein